MQSTFLLSCKYGKLAETTEWDKNLGERKIERTTTTPEKKSKMRRGSGKRLHRISIIFLPVTYQIEEGGVMLCVHEGVGVSLCVEE